MSKYFLLSQGKGVYHLITMGDKLFQLYNHGFNSFIGFNSIIVLTNFVPSIAIL